MSDTNEKSMQKSTVQKKMVNESIASYGAAATKKRRSAISIMGSLIGLVKPLLHIMLAAIILGTAGYLCAIFLTILAGQVIVHGLIAGGAGSVKTIITVMLIMQNNTAIILLHLNFWRSSVTKYSQHCGNSVLRSWKDGTRET